MLRKLIRRQLRTKGKHRPRQRSVFVHFYEHPLRRPPVRVGLARCQCGQSPKRILGLGYVTASHRSIGSTDRWSTSVKYLRYSHDWPNDQHHTVWKRLGSTAVWRCPRPGLDQRRTVEPRTLAHRPMNVRDLDPDAGHPGPPPIRRRCSCKALVIAGEKNCIDPIWV